MTRLFTNDNGITYEIVAENKKLDRTLLCYWGNDGKPHYIVAWGIDYRHHCWAQGHYFLENFKAACDYLNGEEDENEQADHYVPIKNFIRTLAKDTQIAIFDTSASEWMIGCDGAYNTVGFWDWSNLPDNCFVENVEPHHDPDAGDGLWIDVSPDPRD